MIGDRPPLPKLAPPRRLPRAAPYPAPVGLGPGPSRARLQGGLGRRPHVLVEAAWSAAKSPGPLRAFAARTAARRGRHVATVAVARKLAVLAWNLLTREEDYAFARSAQAPPARAERRRGGRQARSEQGPDLGQRHARGRGAPGRRAGRGGLPAADRRLEGGRAQAGRGRDTGARTFRAVFAARSAADLTAPELPLELVGHPRPAPGVSRNRAKSARV